MDFSSFFNNPFGGNKNNSANSEQKQGDAEGKSCPINNGNTQNGGSVSPQDIFSFYQNKTQDELLGEILRQAATRRSEGTLADSDLENFYRQIAPFLNFEQRNKLEEVIKQLK